MATETSNKDKNSHRQQDLDPQNMHHPKGFLQANDGDMSWRDETGNISYIPNPVLPGVLDFVDSSIAPPTEADGDIYLLDATGVTLDVDTIIWQSGTTVRYNFNGAPDLSAISVNDFMEVLLAGTASNNGVFKISAVNDGADWIEITNALRTDATDDEASDSNATGTVTHGDWDGATQNSWVKFNPVNGTWGFITPFEGLLVDDLTVNQQRRFTVGVWVIISVGITGTLTTGKIPKASGASSLIDSILTEAGTVVTVAGGFGMTSATNNKALDDASSTVLWEIDVFSQNDTTISSDDGALLKGYLYVGDDTVELFGGATTSLDLYGDGMGLLGTGNADTAGTPTHIKIVDNSAGDIGSSAFDRNGVFIAHSTGIMKSGVTNTVILGGVGITAKTDDTAYVNQLGFYDSGTIEGLFRAGTLTADRVWELPDIGGQIPVQLMAGFQLSSPSASEDAGGIRFNTDVTIGKVVVVIVGSGTDITWTLRHSTDRNATGNEVITGGTTTSNKTTGQVITSFNDATIPVDSWLWLETTAKSGNLNWFNVTVFYTYDI